MNILLYFIIILFLILLVLVVFWIVSSLRSRSKINKLKQQILEIEDDRIKLIEEIEIIKNRKNNAVYSK
jgi:membrane protein implicated in regulation of membrane protease activity